MHIYVHTEKYIILTSLMLFNIRYTNWLIFPHYLHRLYSLKHQLCSTFLNMNWRLFSRENDLTVDIQSKHFQCEE